MQHVHQIRALAASEPALGAALHQIKHLQSRRFSHSYRDLLAAGAFSSATRFFLEELYSDRDYARRDQQFARIAAALERLFPLSVIDTARALARLHALTEQLDLELARHWLAQPPANAAARYLQAWRALDARADRQAQLDSVLALVSTTRACACTSTMRSASSGS